MAEMDDIRATLHRYVDDICADAVELEVGYHQGSRIIGSTDGAIDRELTGKNTLVVRYQVERD